MRPLPRYVLAIMAAFVAFELWIPLLAFVLRALVGPTIPTAVQAIVPLLGLAVPGVVGLALSDYLADRQGLVRPYQPKRRPGDVDQEEGEERPEEPEEGADEQGELGEGLDEPARQEERDEGRDGPEPEGPERDGPETEGQRPHEGYDDGDEDEEDDGGRGEEQGTGTTRKP